LALFQHNTWPGFSQDIYLYSDIDKEETSMLSKKFFLCAAALMLASALWAGDSAVFVDLGFSPDGKTFMFAQYGVQSGTLKPWAELFVVDVPRNAFVSGGRVSYIHDAPVLAGHDGIGALYRIIARNSNLADQYRITFLNPGQPLYIAMNGDTGSGEIEFRDFTSGVSYKANLVSYTEGTGQNLKSSFFINLESISAAGARRTYTVGSPQIKRGLIEEYRIAKVITAPHDGSLIFIIEMKKQAASGFDIRYMVEAVRL
jgi:predicted secreted protein